jgi:hypothetical protein
MADERDRWSGARFRPEGGGHYESWFQRANHPTQRLAFWIRYTVFVPADGSRPSMGELWAIVFDDDEIIARKAELTLSECRFAPDTLDVRIGDSTLDREACEGAAGDLRWSLRYDSPTPPLLMLDERLYAGGFPKAKLLIGSPLARYRGTLTIGEREISIDDWVGSQNHNWGSRHTDRYAWGQVAGFDNAPDVFFEAATAWLRFGPLWTPPLTVASLRVGKHVVQRVGLLQAARAKASVDGFRWTFHSRGGDTSIRATFEASQRDFVALRYLNPPAGHKACLNSKLARCAVEVDAPGIGSQRFETAHRAAFELLRDDAPPQLPLQF